MANGQTEIAKVNTKSGTLYLSPSIWNGLPKDEKNFVLFHEEGHLRLQTNDEFAANAYAVKKFLHAGTFTNKELGQKIMVMRSILDKADQKTANFTGELIEGASSGIMKTLSVLGIGSKSRIREAEATAAASATIYEAQAKAAAVNSNNTTKIILVFGVLVILSAVIYFTLNRKK